MTTARDDLIDLIEHAAYIHHNQAKVIVDALAREYGEPEIQQFVPAPDTHLYGPPAHPERRLVFPWLPVQTGDNQ